MTEQEFDITMYDEDYAKTEAPEQQKFKPLPDGDHEVTVVECHMKTSTKGGKFLHYYLAPTARGFSYLFKLHNMPVPGSQWYADGLKFLKGDMITMGLGDYLPSDLFNDDFRLEKIVGLRIKVKKVTKPNKQTGEPEIKIWFQKCLNVGNSGAAESSVSHENAEDDNIPF